MTVPIGLRHHTGKMFITAKIIQITTGMSLLEAGSAFCRYCGSPSLIELDLTHRKGRKTESSIGGKLAGGFNGLLEGHLAGDHKRTSDTDLTATYSKKKCETCLNDHIENHNTVYHPVVIESTSTELAVVIPYSLYTYLYSRGVRENDLREFVSQIRGELDIIEERWLKNSGTIPCKCRKRGFKLRIRTTYTTTPFESWIILDDLKGKKVYRLTFGGGNVDCP
jgi:hypothetical protein